MTIKFKTDEYNMKEFYHGPFLFRVYPYGRGEWTMSLYQYEYRQITPICREYDYQFAMELTYRPETLTKIRTIISDFISNL